ncbi:TonB-dependent receptor plug domain-containing protein [Flavobacterium sp.]|jgi:iron complex outermembrane receptor protein|uniref:TonB-dependent receptor plug domain-containing protein n=1 Tax=Flavobacterium sp. TaxID=239 RepID=UPI0037BFA6E0
MKLNKFIYLFLFSTFSIWAQETIKSDTLSEVIVSSTRIDLPFSKNSRTIQLITSEQIKQSGVTNVADLLLLVSGVDVRRRGTSGMQADLYIRGGSFDQTLLLIDGIKVEDAQTGHHTMNLALPIEVIERIEIIKGPAARIFGQNAFTGAINIVTKKVIADKFTLQGQAGSYEQLNLSATLTQDYEKTAHIVQFSRNISEGYRFNTDYDNQNYFIKSTIKSSEMPIDILATFSERKFGANGFYATPAAINQYEETQGSLIGVQTAFTKKTITYKPRVYWRRNQDEYVFVRNNPEIYRNLHITNKVGAELNMAIKSTLGTTGLGVDVAKVYLSSNNLGDRDRLMTTFFFEHRFLLFDSKFDITPGLAANYYSDFDGNIFPGIDVGYQVSKQFRTYANVGKTYRIPTYTDLYYSDPTTLGNENLKQEEALSEEIGIVFTKNKFDFTAAFFNRDAENLIDYTKEQETDKFQANNIRELNTKGFELSSNYKYTWFSFAQRINVGYTFIEDDIEEIEAAFSRYSINSAKHQFTGQWNSQFFKNISQTISYRYVERTSGESYGIVDANIIIKFKAMEFSVMANNIFNVEYTETNLVPMPKGNLLFGVKYDF